MHPIIVSIVIGFGSALIFGFGSIGYSETKIMPQELVEVASENKCSQISDFYENRAGPVNPPYVYGYLPGDEEDSAVFWCLDEKALHNPYVLIFVYKRTDDELTKCPNRIEWNNPPRGLSVYRDRKTTLKGFVYLNDPKRKVPENRTLSNNAIRSYYDGVEEIFYCYKGEWLLRQTH